MKKLLVVLVLIVVAITLLTACSQNADTGIVLKPLPQTTRPEERPNPLDVEFFFATAYKNMSDWQKYPRDTVAETTVAAPSAETTTADPATNDGK